MQCCTCSNWVHLKCSLLSFLNSELLSALTPEAALPAVSLLFWRSHIYQHCDFLLGLLQLVYLHCSIWPIWPPSANAALAPHPLLQISYLISPTLYLLPLHPHYRLMLLAVSLYLLFLLPLPDSLRVLQWNAEGLRARSTKLLHFISYHPADLICIQEFNLNSFSSFLVPEFSALRSDRSHFRSSIFSTDVTDASGGVIILFRQGLSSSELSTSSLSSLDPYSDYVEVNICLNYSSLLSFLNVFAPPIRSSPTDSRTDFFSPSILSSSRNPFILEDFNCHHPLWDSKGISDPGREKHSIGSSPLISSPSMTLTYLLFFIAPLVVATPQTSSLLFFLSPYLAPGRCFRT